MIATFRFWISSAFNSSILGKKRSIWVDYLRGIVIILVVYHHTFLGIEKIGIPVPKSIISANMAFYSFRMPLFFILSGIFTSISLHSKSITKIIWDKFNLLFYPYVIWAVIQITLQIILPRYIHSDSNYSDYFRIFYQPKRLGQFWYLPALFNSTMIFVFVKARLKIGVGSNLALGIILFLLAPFINGNSMMSNWMRFYIFLVIGDILSPFILKKEFQNRLKKPVYIISMIPLFIIAQYYYFHYIGARSLEDDSAKFGIDYSWYSVNELGFLTTSLVGCFTFIVFSFLLEKWNRFQWLRVIGYHSLYIYIMHVMIVSFVRMILTSFLGVHNYLIILAAGITFGVIVPVIFYNLVGKNYLWFLLTLKKPPVKKQEVKQKPLVVVHQP